MMTTKQDIEHLLDQLEDAEQKEADFVPTGDTEADDAALRAIWAEIDRLEVELTQLGIKPILQDAIIAHRAGEIDDELFNYINDRAKEQPE